MIIGSAIFCHLETAYFGYNLHPKTIAELICDGISLVVFGIGVYYLHTSNAD